MANKKSTDYDYIKRSFTADDGKRYFVYGKTEQECSDKIAEIKCKIKSGELCISSSMTVERWAAEWVENYITPKIRPAGSAKYNGSMSAKSAELYRNKLDGYILPAVGKMRLDKVKDIHLQRILNAQAGRPDGSVKKLRMVMCMLFGQAKKSRLIPYNPAEDLSLPATTKTKRRSLTDQEQQALISVASKSKHGLLMRFLMGTGLRPGEAAALQWSDLDLSGDTPVVKVTKAVESGTRVIGTPKTDAGIRTVPIPSDVAKDLAEAACGKHKTAFVFVRPDGRMHDSGSLGNAWTSYRRLMDIELGAVVSSRHKVIVHWDGSPAVSDEDLERFDYEIDESEAPVQEWSPDLYDLRHTYCTNLERAGVPINVAKYLMGHSDITVTSSIYTHTDFSVIQSAAKKIDAINISQSRAGKVHRLA